MKTTWNMGLMYEGIDDPQIDRDVKAGSDAARKFAKKWKGSETYLKDPETLLRALGEYEALVASGGLNKPYYYFFLLTQVETANAQAEARLVRVRESYVEVFNETVFFVLSLGAIDKKTQKVILADKRFARYRHELDRCFKTARHKLPEEQEKILNRMASTSHSMWVDGVEKALAAENVKLRGKQVSLGEAAWTLPLLSRPVREKLYGQIVEKTKKVKQFAEAELNAVLNYKKTWDELRGFAHPYSEMISDNQNDEGQIIRLANIVTEHFPLAHRFFKVKKKLLGIEGKMQYYDRDARVGTFRRKFDFDSSVVIARSAFAKVDPEFAAILDDHAAKGHIDAFARTGKRSGAFCASDIGVPTMVMLNHVPSFDGLKTLAHEMGHAIHAHYSKTQPPLYQGHTLSTAETASTLFENFVFDEVYATLNDDEKIIALHDSIQDSLSSILLQIMGFNFERELHESVRKEGFLSADAISDLMAKHQRTYVGPDFNVTRDNGTFWIRWSHIRSFFYVYTYAYGELVSKAMYAKLKENPAFVSQIKKFLSAGGSDTPENIFKSIGIDTSKDEFWIAGLKEIEKDIAELERLVKGKSATKNKPKKTAHKKRA